MKKTLPIITFLISLSLIGLIILQTSWLNNLVEIRHAQINNRVNYALNVVVTDLSKTVFGNQALTTYKKKHNLSQLNNIYKKLIAPPAVEDFYTLAEIQTKIRNAFDNDELKHFPFEFAVVNGKEEIEMESSLFEKVLADTVNNKMVFRPILPESGTDMEGLNRSENIIIIVPNFTTQVWRSLRWIIVGAVLFMLVIIAAFYITVSTLLNQKKLSEIKSDFINNMTHEFKTPLATISLAVDAMQNEKVMKDVEEIKFYTGIIKEENIRMNRDVETILQAALMEKEELKLKQHPLSTHALIAKVVDNFELQLNNKQALCTMQFNAKNDVIAADEVHFTNAISNLVDNAIKYSKADLHIKITTTNHGKYLNIKIEDNGIGMSKETTKRVFEKFYRAHTGNIHNVKGFGLGMSYVKSVIDSHDGEIKATSVLGKGSSFIIELPLYEKK